MLCVFGVAVGFPCTDSCYHKVPLGCALQRERESEYPQVKATLLLPFSSSSSCCSSSFSQHMLPNQVQGGYSQYPLSMHNPPPLYLFISSCILLKKEKGKQSHTVLFHYDWTQIQLMWWEHKLNYERFLCFGHLWWIVTDGSTTLFEASVCRGEVVCVCVHEWVWDSTQMGWEWELYQLLRHFHTYIHSPCSTTTTWRVQIPKAVLLTTISISSFFLCVCVCVCEWWRPYSSPHKDTPTTMDRDMASTIASMGEMNK